MFQWGRDNVDFLLGTVVAAVDDNSYCELSYITKFSYLLSLLKSEARMAVQGQLQDGL